MSELQQATITIDSIEEKNGRYKVKSREGGTYSFFKYKSGTQEETVAYKQMNDMKLTSGTVVDIGYNTSPGNYQGKQFTYKNISFFRESSVSDTPTQEYGDGARQGMAIKAGIDLFIAGKVDDWKKAANDIYNFTPEKKSIAIGAGDETEKTSDINVEDIPF